MTSRDRLNARLADFGRQLTLPEQKHLFDYWLSLSENGDWPRREAVHPADLRKLVSHLLLLKICPLPRGVEVRLAGSATWDIYGGELTGATLTDDRWGKHADYWRRIYAGMQENPQPMNGHLPRLNGREHLALFWMRLPLRDAKGDTWLLGLDKTAALAEEDTGLDEAGDDLEDIIGREGMALRIPPRAPMPGMAAAASRPQVVLRRRAAKRDDHIGIN